MMETWCLKRLELLRVSFSGSTAWEEECCSGCHTLERRICRAELGLCWGMPVRCAIIFIRCFSSPLFIHAMGGSRPHASRIFSIYLGIPPGAPPSLLGLFIGAFMHRCIWCLCHAFSSLLLRSLSLIGITYSLPLIVPLSLPSPFFQWHALSLPKFPAWFHIFCWIVNRETE